MHRGDRQKACTAIPGSVNHFTTGLLGMRAEASVIREPCEGAVGQENATSMVKAVGRKRRPLSRPRRRQGENVRLQASLSTEHEAPSVQVLGAEGRQKRPRQEWVKRE